MEEILLKDSISDSNLVRLIDALNDPKNIEILELFIASYFEVPRKYVHDRIYLVKKNHHNDRQVCALFVRPEPKDMILIEMNF